MSIRLSKPFSIPSTLICPRAPRIQRNLKAWPGLQAVSASNCDRPAYADFPEALTRSKRNPVVDLETAVSKREQRKKEREKRKTKKKTISHPR